MGFFWIGTTIPALQFNLQPLDPVHALQLIGLINDQKALFTKVLRRSFSNNRTTIHLHMPIWLNIDIYKYINIYMLLPNVCHVLGCRYRARAFWLPIPREADTWSQLFYSLSHLDQIWICFSARNCSSAVSSSCQHLPQSLPCLCPMGTPCTSSSHHHSECQSLPSLPQTPHLPFHLSPPQQQPLNSPTKERKKGKEEARR